MKKWAVEKLAGAESRWECLFYYGRVFKGKWDEKIERERRRTCCGEKRGRETRFSPLEKQGRA